MKNSLKKNIYLLSIFFLLGMAETAYSSPHIEPSAHQRAGDFYLQNRNFEKAITEYEKVIELKSNSTAALFNLAIAYYSMGNFKKAIQSLEKLTELDPQDTEAFYNLGCLRLLVGNLKNSRLAFEKAKNCCSPTSQFLPLIYQGLEFLDEFKELDPDTQDLDLFLLQASLPTQTLVS